MIKCCLSKLTTIRRVNADKCLSVNWFDNEGENQNHAYTNQQYQAGSSDLEKQVEILTQQHQQASKEVIKLTEQCAHMKHTL